MAKKHEEEQKSGAPAWMNTYGDLVTLLLCFFILLFSMSAVDATKYKAVADSFGKRFGVLSGGQEITGTGDSEFTDEELQLISEEAANNNQNEGGQLSQEEAISENIIEHFSDIGVDSDIVVEATETYIKLTLTGELLFDSGSANIKAPGERFLMAIKYVLVANGLDKNVLQIEGHTDNVPINTAQYKSNWYLSSARSIAVGEWLISNFDFNPENISCTGYGEFKPLVSNDTAEGRAKNRRVEFKVYLEDTP